MSQSQANPKAYTKKAVTISALRIGTGLEYEPNANSNAYSLSAITGWMLASGHKGARVVGDEAPYGLAIDTLEGTMIANPGDYVIKGVKNEFYPCKPDIFAETYSAHKPLALEIDGLWALEIDHLDTYYVRNAPPSSNEGGIIGSIYWDYDEEDFYYEAEMVLSAFDMRRIARMIDAFTVLRKAQL